ncbi:uncharacterized protein BDR25DRAFT_357919 [Lindgomyces ingoldianus]|uniref:Uncharacterized protein n=1 Tax=Lindgomyces ingoldianus TaxID=673940 RepID=A0ACB6QNR5_9PLEO|nr:uncharacterized protein BDR25DRAFT_357919 [Lindgomyces ingoldianus]KAF2468175.1 hypothetical protein BDR25DRAFT_357919 [Lindgomyces ingoldianus]
MSSSEDGTEEMERETDQEGERETLVEEGLELGGGWKERGRHAAQVAPAPPPGCSPCAGLKQGSGPSNKPLAKEAGDFLGLLPTAGLHRPRPLTPISFLSSPSYECQREQFCVARLRRGLPAQAGQEHFCATQFTLIALGYYLIAPLSTSGRDERGASLPGGLANHRRQSPARLFEICMEIGHCDANATLTLFLLRHLLASGHGNKHVGTKSFIVLVEVIPKARHKTACKFKSVRSSDSPRHVHFYLVVMGFFSSPLRLKHRHAPAVLL